MSTAKGFAPDILVNVAGILSNNKLLDTTPEEWQKVHAVNLDGPFYLTQACLPHMKEQGWGRIVNISSCECGVGKKGREGKGDDCGNT